MSVIPPFDPSKMDPKLLMELSQLIRQLPPDQLQKMQGLMHNAMAGFDMRGEMEEFEKSLPPGFREKLMTLMASSGFQPGAVVEETPAASGEMGVAQARLTILQGVSAGRISPEEAAKLLFPEG